MSLVSDRIKQARQARGLSQRDLSELTDTPQSQLSRIERGAIDPAFTTVVELMTAMRVSLDSLVYATDSDFVESLDSHQTELLVTMGTAPQTGRPFLISRFASPSPHSIAVGDADSGIDGLIRLELLRTLMGGGRVSVVDPDGQWNQFAEAVSGVVTDSLTTSDESLFHAVNAPLDSVLAGALDWQTNLRDAGAQSLLVLPPLETLSAYGEIITELSHQTDSVGLVLHTASASSLDEWRDVSKHCGWRWVVRQGAHEQNAVTAFLGSPHPETVVFGGGYALAQTSSGETTLISLDPSPAETELMNN